MVLGKNIQSCLKNGFGAKIEILFLTLFYLKIGWKVNFGAKIQITFQMKICFEIKNSLEIF